MAISEQVHVVDRTLGFPTLLIPGIPINFSRGKTEN